MESPPILLPLVEVIEPVETYVPAFKAIIPVVPLLLMLFIELAAMYVPAVKETTPEVLPLLVAFMAPAEMYVPALNKTDPEAKLPLAALVFIVPTLIDVPAAKETEDPAAPLLAVLVIVPDVIYVPAITNIWPGPLLTAEEFKAPTEIYVPATKDWKVLLLLPVVLLLRLPAVMDVPAIKERVPLGVAESVCAFIAPVANMAELAVKETVLVVIPDVFIPPNIAIF
jgi:hypothetical protein